MEHITKVVGTLCIAIMSMGIMYEFGCFKATEKVMKFVITVYVMVTFFATVSDTKIQLDFVAEDIDSHTHISRQQVTEQIVSNTQKELENIIIQRLEQKNICYNSVSVHILEQNGDLTADRITVHCPQQYIPQVTECLSDLITEETQIITGE